MVDSSKYVAIYDFKARSGHEISFKKGAIFVIFKRMNEWLYGRSIAELQRGYVPANHFALAIGVTKEKYFFGNISRRHCEIMLSQRQVPQGTFIIRESESEPGMYTLTVRCGNTSGINSINHYRLRKTGARPLYHITSNPKFSTLSELVEHYKKPGIGLHPHLTDVYSPFPKSKGPPLPVRTSSAISPPAVLQVVSHVSTRPDNMAENCHFSTVFPKSKGATFPRRASSAISPPAVLQVVSHVSTTPENMARNPNSSTVCQSCDEEIATVKFHPCGHTLFCEVCSIPMKKCMLCRSRIESQSEGMKKSRTVREVQLLKQQLNQLIEGRQCEICMERMKVMVFNPCGHGACRNCSVHLRKCHNCRKTIVSNIKTFF